MSNRTPPPPPSKAAPANPTPDAAVTATATASCATMFAIALLPGWESRPLRPLANITHIVVHRIQVSQEDVSFHDTPADIARFFAQHPTGVAATGGAMPYPVLIAPDGAICQSVPLCCVTPHARSYNATAIGIGVIGDFRTASPPPPQYQAVVLVTAALLNALSLSPQQLVGHDELSGGSHDPNKECPGRLLPLDRLRQAAATRLASLPAPHLAWRWM